MARLSRITVPDAPHRVTQRGNRRQALFAEPGDYALYRDLMGERCKANGVACLGPPDEVETWLSAPASEAMTLQRPLPDDALKIVAAGKRAIRGRSLPKPHCCNCPATASTTARRCNAGLALAT